MPERFARWIDARRWAILTVALAVTLVASVLAARLPLHSDFAYLLPDSTPSVQQLHKLEQRVRNLGTVMIGVESSDPAARARAAEKLRGRLDAIDRSLVTAVLFDDSAARNFVWEHRFLYADRADLEKARDELAAAIRRAKLKANPLYVDLEDQDEGAAGSEEARNKLEARLDEAEGKRNQSGFVSKDWRLQLIVVRTSFAAGAATLGARVVHDVRLAAAEVERSEPTVRIGMSGDVFVSLAEHDALLAGMLQAAGMTALIVALGLLLYYRSLRSLAALMLSLAVGTAMTFGFTRLAIGHLNIASAFLSSIVVGNGINFGLLLVARHLEERRAGKRGVEAIAAAIGGTVTGTLAAALTACVAYGSLISTNFRGFRHFGIIGGAGMIFCWVAAYTVLPALLAVLERRGLRVPREPTLGRLLRWALPRSRAAALVVAGAALGLSAAAAVATVLYLRNPYEQDFRNLRSSSPEIDRVHEWQTKLEDAFGHNLSGGVIGAAPTLPAARAAIARLRDADKRSDLPVFSVIRSIDDVLPGDQPAKLAILAELRRMIDHEVERLDDAERARVKRLRPPDDLRLIAESELPEEMAFPFTDKDGHRGTLFFADRSSHFDTWTATGLLDFTRRVEKIDLGPDILLGSANFVFADVIRALERDGPRATLFALAGAILVITLLLGVGRHAGITLLCMTSGTLLMLACAWLAGLRVNFLDFVALPITIGIGIDYSVNIVSRARAEGGGDRAALAATAAAVTVCSFTTVVGYGSLLLSPSQGIRSFGTAAILGELTCITSALFLAPALLLLMLGSRRS